MENDWIADKYIDSLTNNRFRKKNPSLHLTVCKFHIWHLRFFIRVCVHLFAQVYIGRDLQAAR